MALRMCEKFNYLKLLNKFLFFHSSWPIFRLSYMWFAMIGCLLTVFLGWIISLIIEALQRHSVLKITGKGIDNPAISEEVLRGEDESSVPCSVKPIETTSADGHINLAIHIDDENVPK